MTKLNKKGSLLIEALLAIVILSMSLTLIIQSLLTSYRAAVYSGDYSQAVFLAENKMFDLLKNRFIETALTDKGNFDEPYEDYRYEIETHEMSGDNASDAVKEVSLDIIWKTGSKENSLSLATYLLNLP